MNFPHLNDTAFPNASNVDVYDFQNTFDYSRWNEQSRIHLVNVLWNSDYSDCVKFTNDASRDAYFDDISDSTVIQLTQAARIVPDNYVKLPIPYDVMARYNYLYIDIPIAPNSQHMLDYETVNGIRRWYFFIDSVSYLSPNSTQVFITLDVWTNFINDVEIDYMLLERGHAPVAYSDVETYLSNPIANNLYLLAPDVNFGEAEINRETDFVPIGNGTKFLCFVSTCAPEQLSALGTVTSDSSYSPFSGVITYSDIQARYGHQLQVNGLSIGNGRNFGNASVPTSVGRSASNTVPDFTVYCITASQCFTSNGFLKAIQEQCPQFLKTLLACYVVDGNAIVRSGTTYQFLGYTLQTCVGKESFSTLHNVQFSKSDFHYPSRYANFAKLYTSPYAIIECTDNDGFSFNVAVENTSSQLSIKFASMLTFPFVRYRAFLDGVKGSGNTTFSWMLLNGESSNASISNADWYDYLFDWEVPTYALYLDGETAYQLDTFNRNTRMGINNALVAYHNSMRSANTAYENACDSADTAHTNTYNSANTAKTNADNSADTAKANVDDSADTAYTNLDNNCTTLRTNMDLAIANTTAIEELAINTAILMTNENNDLLNLNNDETNLAIVVTTGAEGTQAIASSVAAGLNGQAGATASGGVTGAGIGATLGSAVPALGTAVGALVGALGGMLLGSVGGFVNAMFGNNNAILATQCNQVTKDAVADCNSACTGNAATSAVNQTTMQNTQKRFNYQHNNTLSSTQLNNNNANDRTNGNNTRTTEKANATRTQTTTKTNASNNQNTDKTNADNTQALVKDNAGFTREVSELNAKELLENAANAAQASINDARNNSPLKIGDFSGNGAPDYFRTRGIQIKLKTQSDSAIQQAGDAFARFGYTLNQVWNVANTGLNLMTHFTYWKASEIWVDDKKASTNNIQRTITDIFMNGVTVWENPDEVGRVSIYANERKISA